MKLRRHLAVATCIACGARSRAGECPDGCSDVALDLVEVAEIDSLRMWLEAAAPRVAALRALASALAADAGADWARLRAAARAALAIPLPVPPPSAEIVQAWGCPQCGRIDAPMPCLGVCVRQPVRVADASEYRELEAEAAAVAADEEQLSATAQLIAHVTPHPGQDERTRTALRLRLPLDGGASRP